MEDVRGEGLGGVEFEAGVDGRDVVVVVGAGGFWGPAKKKN